MAKIDAQDLAQAADASKLAPPPIKRVKRFGADGRNQLVDIDNLTPLQLILKPLLEAHTALAASDIEEHLRRTLETEGQHASVRWPEKSEAAGEWSGTFQLWKGRTETLHDSIETVNPNLGSIASREVGDHARAVGWFQKTHPDPGVLGGGRLSPMLSIGGLATVHEYGIEQLGDTGLFNVPARPALRPTVDKHGDEVTRDLMRGIASSITDFNKLGSFQFAGSAGSTGSFAGAVP